MVVRGTESISAIAPISVATNGWARNWPLTASVKLAPAASGQHGANAYRIRQSAVRRCRTTVHPVQGACHAADEVRETVIAGGK